VYYIIAMFNCSYNKGFTLPELLVSMAIVLTIFAFAGINLLRIIPNADLVEVSNGFIADAKSQQGSAMMGESLISTQVDYSIKIDENSYTLFKGKVFSASDPSNYTVEYPSNVTATTNFPSGQVVFSAISGDIEDFNSGTNQVVFHGLYDTHATIMFNKIGNVYYVNKI